MVYSQKFWIFKELKQAWVFCADGDASGAGNCWLDAAEQVAESAEVVEHLADEDDPTLHDGGCLA